MAAADVRCITAARRAAIAARGVPLELRIRHSAENEDSEGRRGEEGGGEFAGVFATRDIAVGEVLFSEAPVAVAPATVAEEGSASASAVLTCAHCLAPVDAVTQLTAMAPLGPIDTAALCRAFRTSGETIPPLPCAGGCGALFCGPSCRLAAGAGEARPQGLEQGPSSDGWHARLCPALLRRRRPGAGAAQAAAVEEYHHRALESGNHAFAVTARLLAALLVQHEEEDANTDNTRGGTVTSPTGWEGILGGFCGAPWWETLRPDASSQVRFHIRNARI